MKLLIDTNSKTIEVLDDTPILEVSNHFRGRMYNEYTIVYATKTILGSVPKIEYNSNTTEDAGDASTI